MKLDLALAPALIMAIIQEGNRIINNIALTAMAVTAMAVTMLAGPTRAGTSSTEPTQVVGTQGKTALPVRASLSNAARSTLSREASSWRWSAANSAYLLGRQDCPSIASADPSDTASEQLTRVAAAAYEATSHRPFAGKLRNFITTAKYQEAIWLLNSHGQRSLGDKLEQSLRCYFLTTSAIIAREPLGGGATSSERLGFANGTQGVFKPYNRNLSSHVGSEVGAYALDRLLHLDMVPLTVKRLATPGDPVGSLQYLVRDAPTASSLPLERQDRGSAMLLFDYLTKNIDRHSDNYLYLGALDKMVAIDNGWGLRGGNLLARIKGAFVDKRSAAQKKSLFTETTLPSGGLTLRLLHLSDDLVRTHLQGLLREGAITRLLHRKHKLVRALIAAHRREKEKEP